MIRNVGGLASLTFVLFFSVCSAQQPSAVELKAVDALKSMGTFLRTLTSFTVRADTTTDEVLDTGQKVQFGGTVEYRVRKPNHLRADVMSDRKRRTVFFDGKTVLLYAPRVNYYASVAPPPTLPELLEVLDQRYGVELPLAALFLWGTEKDGLEDLKIEAQRQGIGTMLRS